MSWIGDLFSSFNPIAPALDFYGAGAADRANRRAMQKQHDLGVQFDSTAIQRRVADAEKAGVHPLFALGASPASGPSLSVVPSEKGEAFRSVSRSIANRMTPEERAFQMLQMEEMKSRTALNFAQSSAIASDQARLGQQSGITGAAAKGAVEIVPGQITSMGPEQYLTAGIERSMTEFNDPAGGTTLFPSSKFSEIAEAVGEMLAPMFVIPMMANAAINRRTHKSFGKKLYRKNQMSKEEFRQWKKDRIYPRR